MISFPEKFHVRYLGSQETSGLFGIENVRETIDVLVKNARKGIYDQKQYPPVRLTLSAAGVEHCFYQKVDKEGKYTQA